MHAPKETILRRGNGSKMSREKNWQFPGKGAIFSFPEWVENNCEKVVSKESIKLKDGSVAGPGDWLILKNGQLTKK